MAKTLGVVLVVVWELDDAGRRIKKVYGPEWIDARTDEDVRILMARTVSTLPPEKMDIQTAWVFRRC